MIASLTDRELGHVLAALRAYQQLAGHSADLDGIATDAGTHDPMSPDEIDDLCERLNLTTTARRRPRPRRNLRQEVDRIAVEHLLSETTILRVALDFIQERGLADEYVEYLERRSR